MEYKKVENVITLSIKTWYYGFYFSGNVFIWSVMFMCLNKWISNWQHQPFWLSYNECFTFLTSLFFFTVHKPSDSLSKYFLALGAASNMWLGGTPRTSTILFIWSTCSDTFSHVVRNTESFLTCSIWRWLLPRWSHWREARLCASPPGYIPETTCLWPGRTASPEEPQESGKICSGCTGRSGGTHDRESWRKAELIWFGSEHKDPHFISSNQPTDFSPQNERSVWTDAGF